MTKARQNIPAKLRSEILNEYNHRCAICGCDRPQLHHIDEDPSNNDAENLIPLCPNCHLSDQHNPTVPLAPEKIRLFRRYKDPTILSSQFEAIFKRTRFLEDIRIADFEQRVDELLNFIGALEMGHYYAKYVGSLIDAGELRRRKDAVSSRREWRKKNRSTFGDRPLWETESLNDLEQSVEDYYTAFNARREAIYDAIVELLRFQPWGKAIDSLYPADRGS